MKLLKKLTTCLIVGAILAFSFAGCEQQGPAEKAGEAVDDAMDTMGDSVEDAGDAIEDAADKAKEKTN